MKLSYQQLTTHLQKQLLPIYLIAGNEPLFVQESKDLINQKAKQSGFLERQRYDVNKDFNWNHLFEAINSPSLFGDKTIFELRLLQKPTATFAKTFAQFINDLTCETLLIIYCEKLDSATQKSSWCEAITNKGAVINIWPLEPPAFQQWLKQRLQQQNLSDDQRLIQFIMHQTEGNALAAAQEIEKLKLIYPNGKIPYGDLDKIITDNARFDIFGLVDVILAGNTNRIIQVFRKIRAEGIEPTLILWAITREIRTLINVLQDLNQRISLEVSLKKNSVWGKRTSLIKTIAPKLTIPHLHHALLHAEKIDKMIKGMSKGNVWDELQLLALHVSGCKFVDQLLGV